MVENSTRASNNKLPSSSLPQTSSATWTVSTSTISTSQPSSHANMTTVNTTPVTSVLFPFPEQFASASPPSLPLTYPAASIADPLPTLTHSLAPPNPDSWQANMTTVNTTPVTSILAPSPVQFPRPSTYTPPLPVTHSATTLTTPLPTFTRSLAPSNPASTSQSFLTAVSVQCAAQLVNQIPMFEGDNGDAATSADRLEQWLTSIETAFPDTLEEYEECRLRTARMRLGGEVKGVVELDQTVHNITSWETLKGGLRELYGKRNTLKDHTLRLANIKLEQCSSLNVYLATINSAVKAARSSYPQFFPPELILSYFLSGLPGDMRTFMMSNGATTLESATKVVRAYIQLRENPPSPQLVAATHTAPPNPTRSTPSVWEDEYLRLMVKNLSQEEETAERKALGHAPRGHRTAGATHGAQARIDPLPRTAARGQPGPPMRDSWSRTQQPFRCRSCGTRSHSEHECPFRREGDQCNGCGDQGHTRRECPYIRMRCYECAEWGHIRRLCPYY